MSPGQQIMDVIFSLFGTLMSGLISTLFTTFVSAVLEPIFMSIAASLGVPQP